MISVKNGLFHLQTESFSYLFRLTPHGQLEHLHFGSPITSEDADALACKPGLGWGSSVLYNEEGGICLDVLPLEWSGSGRGDYRESPVELFADSLPLPTDFTYSGHRIFPAEHLHSQTRPSLSSLPSPQSGGELLEVTLCQPDGLVLNLYWTLFDGAITRRVVLKNNSARPVSVHKLMSFSLDLPGSFEMTTFDGGWIAEMRENRTPVGAARIVHDSTTGSSSNRHQPGFLLSHRDAGEDHGAVYGFNLIYSGNHYAAAQRSLQGLTRVMQGISPDHFSSILQPGQSFETPEAVLAFSSAGFNGLSHRFHDFINHHIVPAQWQNKPRPVLYNSWEGCFFDFNLGRLTDLAKRAAKLGCELFVLDDGWFGARNDDTAGLGDYNVNEKKLPGGLKALADKVSSLGMEFGLWFEPESVNPDSNLYRAHPDWVLSNGLPDLLGRHQLLLDLTRPEVRDYIVNSVSGILDSANITYVKWDMNRHSTALGEKAHSYILGLYEILHRIFDPRPHILLESCSSGGNRFDLGMLCFSPQIWCSDNTDPVERLNIQNSLSYLYPQSTFGAHVSAAPHAQTLRDTPLSTRGNVSFFGILGYELDLKHLLPVEEQEVKNQIAFYKEHRKVFQFGRFTRISGNDYTGWQVSDGSVHIAGLFHRLLHSAPGYERLRMSGLDSEKRYQVANRPQKLRVGQFGALVKHIAPVNLDPNGIILRTVDKHYAMEDGTESFTASGSALSSGVMLSSLFTGTGYDKALRVQGDFSSYIYVAQETEQEADPQ